MRAAGLAHSAWAEAAWHGGVKEAVLVEELTELGRWPVIVCRAVQREGKQCRSESFGGGEGKEGGPSPNTRCDTGAAQQRRS